VSALKLDEEMHIVACKCLSVIGSKMHFSEIHDQKCLFADVYAASIAVGILFLKVLMGLIISYRLP
jgi:hypothetical protein